MIKGLHHISMKCSKGEQFNEVMNFYTGILGLKIAKTWGGEENPDGVLFETGNGLIELFTNRTDEPECGIIRHFALETDNADLITDEVRKAGYEIITEPKNITVPFNARIAFCIGPMGETVEFIQFL